MICKRCGKENSDLANTCYFCGYNLAIQNNTNTASTNNNFQANTNSLNIFGVQQNQSITSNVSSQNAEIRFDTTPSQPVNTQPLPNQMTPISQNNFASLNNPIPDPISNVQNSQQNPMPNNNPIPAQNYMNSSFVRNNINSAPISNNGLNNIGLNNSSIVSPIESNQTTSNIESVPKKKKGNTLFIVAAFLFVAAIVLIAIPFLTKGVDKIDDSNISNNNALKGEISITNTDMTQKYDVSSNYSKVEDYYNVKYELSSDEGSFNLYMEISKVGLNIYLPSEFIDLFGKTKSNESKWIKYSISFVKEINIDNKLTELFDDSNFKYINDINDTKHYRLILDDKIYSVSSKEDFFNNKNLELYTKDDSLTRFAILINNIGDKKTSINIDSNLYEDSSSKVVIPSNVSDNSLSLDLYIENNKIGD